MYKNEKKTVLLVEDQRLIAMLNTRTLESFGYEVLTATSGEQAIEIMRATPRVSLVLMDIDLGEGIDGTEAAEIILKEHDLPLVFLSSHTSPEVVDKTEKITSYGYIVKDSGDTVLQASIKMAFRLFEARNRYKNVFNHSLNGFVLYRLLYKQDGEVADAVHVDLNSSFEQQVGMPRQALVGRSLREIYPSGEGNVLLEFCAQVARSGVPHRKELYFEPLKKWFELSVIPMEHDELAVVSHDVSARKQAEHELSQSETRFQKMLSLVPDMISIQDPHMNIVYSNWNGFGAVPEELRLLNTKCHQTYRGTAEICPDCRAVQVMTTKKPFEQEVELPDGSWVDLRVIPILDEHGEVELFVEWVRDITHNKRSEQELKSQKQLLEGVIDGISDVLSIQNADYTIERFNKAGYDMLGLTESDVKGRKCYEMVGRTYECEVCATRNALHSKQLETVEKYVPELDVHLECSSNPVLNDEGEVVHIVEQLRDISERVRQKQRLEESEEKYRALFSQSMEGIYLHDLNGRIFEANDMACTQSGYAREELLGLTMFDLQAAHPGAVNLDREGVLGQWRAWLPGQRHSMEAEYRRKDGTVFPVRVAGGVVRYGGEEVVMATVEDITERKENERQIQQLAAEREIMVKEVQHRVKNTMHTMVGLLSLQAGSLTDPDAVAALHDAKSRFRSMELLYDQLYRAENHNSGSVKGYLTQLVQRLTELFPHKDRVAVSTSIEDFPLDARRLSPVGMIVNELVTNAMKHAFTHTVESGRLDVSAVCTPNGVRVTVEDNGQGLPPAFEPKQASSFGLTMVNALVAQLNGSIRCRNGTGTRWELEFPT